MDHLTMLGVAIGLSMDCFASALSCGIRTRTGIVVMALKIASIFALVQTMFAVLGWFAGSILASSLSWIDHWIAFILLLIVGGRMLHESFKARREGRACSSPTTGEMIVLGIGTSIDSLIVGGSLAMIQVSILMPAIYIFAITALLTLSGGLLGGRLSDRFGIYAEIGGGLMIVAIGMRILISHLLQ
jgi:putative Mn2+ efflux pump MntP